MSLRNWWSRRRKEKEGRRRSKRERSWSFMPKLETLEQRMVLSAAGLDPQIYIPTAGLSGSPGQVITVPVKMNVNEPTGISIAGVYVAFNYDSNRFTISNVRLGSALTGFGFSNSF